MTFWLMVLSGLLLGEPMIPFAEVKRTTQASDALLLDRHGREIHTLRVRNEVRQLKWTAVADVAPNLVQTLLLSEDRRFYHHNGSDLVAISHAIWDRLKGKSLRGASTLSMQLAAHLEPRLKRRSRRRSLWQKLIQLKVAWQLERQWTKSQILEAYLNLTPFRGELRGIEAVSQGLFQKSPHGLSPFESQLIVALIPSPNARPSAVAARACRSPSCSERVEAILTETYRVPRLQQWAPHVASALLSPSRRQARSTLDGDLQRFALQAVEAHLAGLEEAHVQDAAVLVVDNASGEVLAYVGSPRQGSSRPHVDGVLARRQAGSTLKPFLYGLAFEQKWLTPQTRIWDLPLEIPMGRGVYRPMNHDRQFRGGVSARQALASSLNVPAVRVLQMVGLPAFHRRLQSLGVSQLRAPDHYGPSLALGSVEVSLWELVNAYRTLANRGVWSRLTLKRGPSPPSRSVLSPGAAYLIGEILSDREARELTFGLENTLSTRSWGAVKTGTSKGMRDNWCVGFSDRFTIGVWVGNFPGDSMWNVVGTDGAAPIWKSLFTELHRGTPSRRPPPPPGIQSSPKGAFAAHIPPGRSLKRPSVSPQIRSPADGTRFAWDPDIPLQAQKIAFEREGTDVGWEWVLNGKRLASSEALYFWTPKAGRHQLALRTPQGRTVSHVSFEVVGFPP